MNLSKNKEFKAIFSIGIFTNIGDSIFFIVTMWYVANNFDNSFYTGLVVFLFTLPETLLIFLGPFIDRFHPKKLLTLSSVLQLAVHLAIILLFIFELVTLPLLLSLLLLSAIASATTYPVEETMLPHMVEKHQLIRANSLFSVAYKMTNSLFDGLAGMLLATFAVSFIYGINLFVFLIPFFIIRILKVTLKREASEPFQLKQYGKDLKEGLSFVLKSNIRLMAIPLSCLNFFTAINIVALPFFANTLSPSPATYGLLLSFSGIGSMLGALVINRLEKNFLPGKILTVGLLLNGITWLLTIVSPTAYFAYVFIFLANFCMGGYNIIFASLFQVMTPPQLLGRINTCVDSIITLTMPLGSLIGGLLITVLPVRTVMLLNAIALIATGVIYFFNKTIFQMEKIGELEAVEVE